MAKLENIQHTDDMTVSCIDISNLISQLKCGKAAGSDTDTDTDTDTDISLF